MENNFFDMSADDMRAVCHQCGCPCPNGLPDDWVDTWQYLTTRSWGDDAMRIIEEALKLTILGLFEENEVHDLEAFAEKFAQAKIMHPVSSETP